MYENFLDTSLASGEEEVEKIHEKIKMIDNGYELLSYAYIIIPNWILHKSEHYISEYSHLERNWHELCTRWGTTPKYILAVDFIPPQNEVRQYSIVHTFCNLLTRHGYVIRHQSHLSSCQKCNKMMLSQQVWQHMKTQLDNYRSKHPNSNIPSTVPGYWGTICQECNPTNESQNAQTVQNAQEA